MALSRCLQCILQLQLQQWVFEVNLLTHLNLSRYGVLFHQQGPFLSSSMRASISSASSNSTQAVPAGLCWTIWLLHPHRLHNLALQLHPRSLTLFLQPSFSRGTAHLWLLRPSRRPLEMLHIQFLGKMRWKVCSTVHIHLQLHCLYPSVRRSVSVCV